MWKPCRLAARVPERLSKRILRPGRALERARAGKDPLEFDCSFGGSCPRILSKLTCPYALSGSSPVKG